MTAGQPTRRDLLRNLTQEAIENGSYGEPAPDQADGLAFQMQDLKSASQPPANQRLTAPKSPADDLRQQLTKAIERHTIAGLKGGFSEGAVHAAAIKLADVCAAVVQPVLDAKDADIEDLHTLIASERQIHEATIQRAEAAENELATMTRIADGLHRIANQQNGDQP